MNYTSLKCCRNVGPLNQLRFYPLGYTLVAVFDSVLY